MAGDPPFGLSSFPSLKDLFIHWKVFSLALKVLSPSLLGGR